MTDGGRNVRNEGGPPPLSVATDLSLRINGADAAVESTGERLLVDFGSTADAFRASRHQPNWARNRLGAVLTETDLTVEIRVRGRPVAVLGVDARPGVLSRQIGVHPAEVRLGGLLGGLGGDLSAALGAVARPVEDAIRGR